MQGVISFTVKAFSFPQAFLFHEKEKAVLDPIPCVSEFPYQNQWFWGFSKTEVLPNGSEERRLPSLRLGKPCARRQRKRPSHCPPAGYKF